MHTKNFPQKTENPELLIAEMGNFRNFPAIEDILEVTYKYSTFRDENGDFLRSDDGDILAYNHIFPALTGMDYENAKENGEKIFHIASEKIWNYQKNLDEIEEKIKISSLKENEKKMMISTIKSYKNRLEIAKTWLIFELEKAGIKIPISENEKNERISKIENLQSQEFGENVSESWQASEQVFYRIRKNFHKNSEKFSEEERKKFENLYNKMKNFVEKKHQKHIPNLDDFTELTPLRDDLEALKKIMIPREEYVKIFQLAIEMMGLHQRVEISDTLSSIFDGADVLGIPASEWYEKLSLSRVLELISHEIRSHYVNQKNSEMFANGIRSAGDIEKEEGLAMLMEGLLRGYTLSEIAQEKRGISEARVLAGEIFHHNKQDFKDFISLNKKNSTGKLDADESLTRRASRNLPIGYTQKKDLSYGLGLQKVIDYISKSGDLKKLFSGKFGIQDIISGDADFSGHTEMLLPFFVEDIIIFYMNDKNAKLSHSYFVDFLRQKYGHILKENDFDAVEKLTHSSLRKVCKILDSIKKSQENSK